MSRPGEELACTLTTASRRVPAGRLTPAVRRSVLPSHSDDRITAIVYDNLVSDLRLSNRGGPPTVPLEQHVIAVRLSDQPRTILASVI